ncbi:MAG: SurA N-terminal domain-containing protein [Desulfosarcinaceae bacterium]|nr:SurA N-terminal domain-containing protein [Desulfosarcinaceae bacterium]
MFRVLFSLQSKGRGIGSLAMLIVVMNLSLAALAQGAVVDRIVAVVNDDIVLLSELNEALAPYYQKIAAAGYTEEQARRLRFKTREEVLGQLVDDTLTAQEIKRLGLTASSSEIDSMLERIKEVNYLTDEELRAALQREGTTLADYREDLKTQLLRTKLVNLEVRSKIVVTEADIKAYYEANAERYAGEQVYHLRNIILIIPDAAAAPAVRRKMEAIVAEIEAGLSFAEAARQYSESVLAEEGGDLGRISLSTLSDEIRAALDGLAAGDFTEILVTDQGLQIFYVESLSTATGRDLAEASAEIEDTLFKQIVDQKFNTWLESLRSRAHIKIIK